MNASIEATFDLPDTGSTVLKALETERRRLHAWAAGLVKEVEGRRDEALRRLDLSESALTRDTKVFAKPAPTRSKRPGGKRGMSPAVLAERRRETILLLLIEQKEALSFSEIHTATRFPEFSTRSALRRLVKEEKVLRTGAAEATRYAARDAGAGSVAALPGRAPEGGGTLQGRLVELIADRGSASVDELAQAFRVPREEIQAACGGLIREEEERMASRGGATRLRRRTGGGLMARTFAEALAAVEGAEFDAAVGYTVKRPAPMPIDKEVASAFRGFDYGEILRIERMLVSRHHCHLTDAEEAVHEVLEELLVKRPDLYRERPENWLGLLYKLSRFRILDGRTARSRVASIDELFEVAGDAPFEKARPCVAIAPADEDAKYAVPPVNGARWCSEQIIGALQRFRDRIGRPPRSTECTAPNGLPDRKAICREFGSLASAILAAGMVPETPSKARARWIPLEVAKVCRSFRRRNGYWPSSVDVKRRPGELPSTTAMIRCFGGTRSIDVQLGADAILAGTED